jgi:predicted O-methyltransferase YrrM
MNSIRDDPRIAELLRSLHARSRAQDPQTAAYLAGDGARTTVGDERERAAGRGFWRDKYVALDEDKAGLCYLLCRTHGVRRAVEAGTSFGVSTIYLAAAVRDNGGGTVIGTELEHDKAAVARRHFAEAGLGEIVDLRQGDIRATLAPDDGPVDLLLLDIWIPLVGPTLEMVAPRMPVGAILIADNTTVRRADYAPLFEFLEAPVNGFTTTTLPYDGGLELAIRTT